MFARHDYSQRAQPVALYLLALVSFVLACTLGISKELGMDLVARAVPYVCTPAKINWLSRDEAIKESGKTGKPILYAVLFKNEWRSLKFEYHDLKDKQVADFINNRYLAVKYVLDKPIQTGTMPPRLIDLDRQMNVSRVESLALFVVASKLRFSELQDIYSRTDFLQLNWRPCRSMSCDVSPQMLLFSDWLLPFAKLEEWRPYCGNYKDSRELFAFLQGGYFYPRFKQPLSLVRWQPVSLLQVKTARRPRVLVLIDEIGWKSYLMCNSALRHESIYKILNSQATPIVLETDSNNPASKAQVQELMLHYGVKSLPAIILVDYAGSGAAYEGAELMPIINHLRKQFDIPKLKYEVHP
ncbi:MAG: hypothetical protein QG625_1624 [Cyanobacteriota bacterium erpe_2018_sw_39hr_WHONDRS-SW48-000098_B_bin.30]|nr:hypothetical protein [Cyanobacteriota bacterium erpe_2018_sw_39hr_WHONDRS-SW48-000098_B_bin.30]